MFKQSIEKLYRLIPQKLVNQFSRPRLLPLVYHTVGNISELPYLKGLYNVNNSKSFIKDLDFLLKYYQPISLTELNNYVHSGVLPGTKKCFFLSFDDGLKGCKEIIAPILTQKGIPATFFINTGFINNIDFLHRFKTNLIAQEIIHGYDGLVKKSLEQFFKVKFQNKYIAAEYILNIRYPQKDLIEEYLMNFNKDILNSLKHMAPYMSLEDIKSLNYQGFTFGAHSVNHPEYYLIDINEQINQTCESVKKLNEWINPKHNVFAFPFTDVGVSNTFFKLVSSNCKIDLTFGTSGLKTDTISRHIHRIPMDTNLLSAKNNLRMNQIEYGLKRLMGKNIYKRN